MKIKTIIIDDERKSIETLKYSLAKLCPNIEIISATQDPLEAIRLVNELKPNLVFLDIAMPELSGFDVLSRIENPDFEVIFVTAFDDHAIKAINYCAIGYIVKPLSDEELVESVNRATESIEQQLALKKNLQLIDNIGVSTFQNKKIVIPTQEGLEFIKTNDIIYCKGTEGYTKLYFKNKKTQMLSSKRIGYFHDILQNQQFYLTHKSYLINMSHIEKYMNEGYILLVDGHKVPVSRNKRNDFLNEVKKMG